LSCIRIVLRKIVYAYGFDLEIFIRKTCTYERNRLRIERKICVVPHTRRIRFGNQILRVYNAVFYMHKFQRQQSMCGTNTSQAKVLISIVQERNIIERQVSYVVINPTAVIKKNIEFEKNFILFGPFLKIGKEILLQLLDCSG